MIQLPSPALIGMVHLPALPGSPLHCEPMRAIIAHALADAVALQNAGFDAIMIENFGDSPFTPERLPPASLAGLAVVADRLASTVRIPFGINALRNDAMGALGIAAATGAAFVRVNVLTGAAVTDQGVISGRADEVLRYRKLIGLPIAIFADVEVKHARPIGGSDIAQAAKEAAYRGLADALIVSGVATGQPVDQGSLERVCEAVPDRPVYVGSGATAETIGDLLRVARGVIVGSSLKPGGDCAAPIDPQRARAFVRAAREG